MEIDARTDWLDGRARVNAAAFWYDYADLQATTFFQSLTLVSNAADATVPGIDLEVTAQPTERLVPGASLSFPDATYDSFDLPYGVRSEYAVTNLDDPGCADVPKGGIITDSLSVGHALGCPAPGRPRGLGLNHRF